MRARKADLAKIPTGTGGRGWLYLSLVAAALWSLYALRASGDALVPGGGGLAVARDFAAAALRPAFDYEDPNVPASAPAFLARLAGATARTVVFATCAMSIALPLGLGLGFLASAVSWSGEPALGRRRRVAAPLLQALARLCATGMRSVHELMWAVLLLAAVGLSTATAVIALAIPTAGTLAKVFSELLDESPPGAADGLRDVGASPARAFLFGRLVRAAPDLAAYAFYRFECSLRSSAVLGFFGFTTLGYYLKAAFDNLHYREVWSYLYALLVLVLLMEAWSAQLRRRFVA